MRPERNGWTPGPASSAPPDRMIRAGQAAVARLSLAVVTSPPAPDRRTVLTQSAAETFPADAPPPGTYALDPECATVRADVKAMFGLFTVHGTFRLKSGQVVIAAEPGGSRVRASLDAASYASGDAKRDAHVLSPGLLDARGFPEITFTGQGARRDGADWVVTGLVTAHGTPAPAQVRVSGARFDGAFVPFLATARPDRTRSGVTKKRGTVGRAGPVVTGAVGRPAGPRLAGPAAPPRRQFFLPTEPSGGPS